MATLGGWTNAQPAQPKWAPYDLNRGAAWSGSVQVQPKWAPNDAARGTSWAAVSKGKSTW